MAIFRRLLSAGAAPQTSSVEAWWARHEKTVAGAPPIEAALLAGAAADRLGWAFASGYQVALRALVPGVGFGGAVSLCASEEDGAHPRAIAATLADIDGRWVLSGRKRWATLGTHAIELLVVACAGLQPAGKKRLCLLRLDAGAPGVTIEAMPETPFAPEVPHAVVTLEGVVVPAGDVLPGDGYARYLKPFRTVEDLYVHAALVGHLAAVAGGYGWPQAAREELVAIAATLVAVSALDLTAPETHVLLAGALAQSRRFVAETAGEWERAPAEVRARFQRDLPLLAIAERVRGERTTAAWRALSAVSS